MKSRGENFETRSSIGSAFVLRGKREKQSLEEDMRVEPALRLSPTSASVALRF